FNYKTDNPNCPGDVDNWGLEPTGYYDNGTWNAFTGSSGGWYQEIMDLSQFAGHTIDLYFTYWTDPYTLEAGWYIDDIHLSTENDFFDDVEDGVGDWIAYDGWVRDNYVHDNDFEVNLITIKNCFEPGSALYKTSTHLSFIDLDDYDETGVAEFELIDKAFIQQYVVMVVTNQPGYEHTFTSSYSFTALKK
ncbi:MAG: immune inhibitor A, partial [Candidatus Lokiarchaeota archaeon]|nr:immune inhibitor A [Candidatus Lokiarchaeota archaeon]